MKLRIGKRIILQLTWFCFAVLCFHLNVFALSGFAVSDYSSGFHGIDVHFIENNEWKDSVFLIANTTRLKARFPAINSHGTHCAFLHNESDGWYVCVIRIGGLNKTIKKLVKVPNAGDFGDGRIWSAIVEWPRGDCIWFDCSTMETTCSASPL